MAPMLIIRIYLLFYLLLVIIIFEMHARYRTIYPKIGKTFCYPLKNTADVVDSYFSQASLCVPLETPPSLHLPPLQDSSEILAVYGVVKIDQNIQLARSAVSQCSSIASSSLGLLERERLIDSALLGDLLRCRDWDLQGEEKVNIKYNVQQQQHMRQVRMKADWSVKRYEDKPFN